MYNNPNVPQSIGTAAACRRDYEGEVARLKEGIRVKEQMHKALEEFIPASGHEFDSCEEVNGLLSLYGSLTMLLPQRKAECDHLITLWEKEMAKDVNK
jgi:hypothetical protein